MIYLSADQIFQSLWFLSGVVKSQVSNISFIFMLENNKKDLKLSRGVNRIRKWKKDRDIPEPVVSLRISLTEGCC
jgi:hypothetical protein